VGQLRARPAARDRAVVLALLAAIVTQLNAIYNFRGRAKIRSFYAPYVATRAAARRAADRRAVAGARIRPNLPTFACPDCQAAMEFDDLPERYLSFLAEA
jgi:hypothetical protein